MHSKEVKKTIVFLLLFLQLLTNTELCELLKIPVLINHYHKHKGNNGKFTFVSFLRMHYFNGKPHDGTDMELPFKSNASALAVTLNFSIPLPHPPQIPALLMLQQEIQEYKCYSIFIPSGNYNTVFQPPRFS